MKAESSKSIKLSGPSWHWLAAAVIIVVAIVATWAVLRMTLFANSDEAGKFGDYFGGINALFSGLAFAGLIYTVLLQKTELALQREELRDTREELKKQALALAAGVEPRIEVSMTHDWGLDNHLVIQNKGQTAASDISVRCIPDVTVPFYFERDWHEKKFSDLPIARKFTAPQSSDERQAFSLDPGEKLSWKIKEDLHSMSVRLDVTYNSPFAEHKLVSRVIGGPMYEHVTIETDTDSRYREQLLRKLDSIADSLRSSNGRLK